MKMLRLQALDKQFFENIKLSIFLLYTVPDRTNYTGTGTGQGRGWDGDGTGPGQF